MGKTWYVVAHRAGARILEPTDQRGTLALVETFDNPEGRLMNHELESDRPGGARAGVSTGLYERHEDAHLHVAKAFARELADRLERAREQQAIGAFVLVAEPRFLGLIRQSLPKQTAALVRETIARDFHHVETHDLAERIRVARDES